MHGYAISAFGEMGEPVVPELTKATNHKNQPYTRKCDYCASAVSADLSQVNRSDLYLHCYAVDSREL